MPAAPRTSPDTPAPAGPPRRFEAVRARLPAVLAVVVTVAAGLGVRALTGGWFGKYAGDALYTVLVHALVVAAVPRVSPFRAAACALAFSWAVEFAQLTPVPAALSEASVLARLVLGSTFGAVDLAAYAAGALLAATAHTAAVAVHARHGHRTV
ncbi:DUF2809 domain-containing protein [Streptosporangium sp. NPDC048047]|uniref:ribosomal maturation YjgA family protein n=1 Tax=Streptosporangium sp. NPDC048047 TaxID=3155748 RepID=UPI003432A7E8